MSLARLFTSIKGTKLYEIYSFVPFACRAALCGRKDSHAGKEPTDYFPLLLRRLRRPSAEAISRPIGRGSEERRRILEGWDTGSGVSGRNGIFRCSEACGADAVEALASGASLWALIRASAGETEGRGLAEMAGWGESFLPDAFPLPGSLGRDRFSESFFPLPAAMSGAFWRSALGGRGGRTALGGASKISMGQGWLSISTKLRLVKSPS